MTTHTLEPNPHAHTLPTTAPPTARQDRPDRRSLRTDLYLIAHHDDTGHPHLDKEAVTVGLAGAVLLELWHTGRIHLGWRQHPRHGRRNPGQITLLDTTATGDPINDTALTLLWRMGGTVDTHRFINEFATTGLYQQVRDHLITTGILRAVTRRRLWFLRTTIHRPANPTHTIRARMRIRDVARLYRPCAQDTSLAALVIALGLTRDLNLPDTSITGVYVRLAELVAPDHPLHDITSAIRPHHIRYQ